MTKIEGFRGTLDWYNENAMKYAQNIESFSNPELLEKFVKLVGVGGTVLDAGCAAGRDSRLLKDLGMDPVGIDMSVGLLEIAREKNPDIEFRHGDFLNLPFENEMFGGVWASASLLHLEEIEQVEQALREFHRVLKNEGIVHISVKQQMGEEKTSIVKDSLSNHNRFFRWFTPEEVRGLLEEADFTLLSLESDEDKAGRQEVKWMYTFAKKK